MKSFNHENDGILQYLFKNYLINQSVFSALSGNKQYADQAKNLMTYPMTFESYCDNVYHAFIHDRKNGFNVFNDELNKNSGEALARKCESKKEEDEMFEQIKDVSFIYTNVINCYNNLDPESKSTNFSSKTYGNFVDNINCYGPNLYKDEGLNINNELYGGRFCEETLNLLKKPMEESEFYLLGQNNQDIFNRDFDFFEENVQ